MMTITDFSLGASADRLEEVLFLLVAGAMIYSGAAYGRHRGGAWPQVFKWSALGALLLHALPVGGRMVREWLRVSDPPREDLDLPVKHETWDFLGSFAGLWLGVALLVCGLSLIFLGWHETKAGSGRPKRRPRGPRSKGLSSR